jgi:hypothetical protein
VSTPRPRRPPRRGRRRAAIAAGFVVVFLAGLGLGGALEDGPPSGMQTLVRTLRPLPLVPAALRTVTVTTTPG